MDIKKHLEEIKNFQIKLEIEYLANITKHKETLSKLMDNCQLNVDKDDTQKTKEMKDEISSNTNEILEYEDHLYNINKKNLKLIEQLYKELESKQ
ncbi:MAG: hypothetical protein HRT43_08645 [Campylobacteraceae bacterium]|nr:hypothetical protein [Campylobacteraceae bacterium]